MSSFHPREVAGRGGETQLQVGEKLNFKMTRFKSWYDILEHNQKSVFTNKAFMLHYAPNIMS